MDLGLRDRVALVAAGSKGLGRAIALELAAEGAQVVICARGKDALDATVAEITGAGGRAFGFVADVSTSADVARLVESARSACGPIDILVTNSGGPRSGTFDVLSPEDWDQATRVLLTSAVELTRAVVPDMRARRWGRILNITSIAAKQPVDGLMLSNSLRAAVTAFARTLANEVAKDGITVNNLLPGGRTGWWTWPPRWPPRRAPRPKPWRAGGRRRFPWADSVNPANLRPWPRFWPPTGPVTSPGNPLPWTAAGFAG